MKAARIAVGSKIFHIDCMFYLQLGTTNPHLKIAFKTKGNLKSGSQTANSASSLLHCEHKIRLDDDSIKECRSYFSTGETADVDDIITFLALRITPDENNGFVRYSNAYANDEKLRHKGMEIEAKRYIVIETRNNNDMQNMLTGMRKNKDLATFLEGCEVAIEEAKKCSSALLLDNEKRKLSSIRSNKRKKNRALNETSSERPKLVYPFNATPDVLQEVNSIFVKSQESLSTHSEDKSSSERDTVIKEDDISIATGDMGRTHLLTIRGEDIERLEPGEFLNDTIIDFWMKWCVLYTRLNESFTMSLSNLHDYQDITKRGPSYITIPFFHNSIFFEIA